MMTACMILFKPVIFIPLPLSDINKPNHNLTNILFTVMNTLFK